MDGGSVVMRRIKGEEEDEGSLPALEAGPARASSVTSASGGTRTVRLGSVEARTPASISGGGAGGGGGEGASAVGYGSVASGYGAVPKRASFVLPSGTSSQDLGPGAGRPQMSYRAMKRGSAATAVVPNDAVSDVELPVSVAEVLRRGTASAASTADGDGGGSDGGGNSRGSSAAAGGGGGGAGGGAGGKKDLTVQRRGWGVSINGKELGASPHNLLKFMVSGHFGCVARRYRTLPYIRTTSR